MLYYNGNPETVHVLNWLFHSGEVDLHRLIEQVLATAEESPEEILASHLHDHLVHVLHDALDDVFTDEALHFEEFGEAKDYVGPVRDKLAAPLLGLTLGRIDFDAIAVHLFAWAKDVAHRN
ncbi:MAG: hypothetical protein ABSF26_24310 [Thermoguttaceae bacterium]|jgi:hypothetical protein